MSGRRDATPLPGSRLHRVARRLLDPNTVRVRIEPAIADLQHEARASDAHGVKGALLLRRGYAACVVVILVNLLCGGMRMWTPSRTWLAAAACGTLAAVVLIGATLALPHFVFGLISAGLVLPLVEMAVTAGARWSLRRALILACAGVPLGYVAGTFALNFQPPDGSPGRHDRGKVLWIVRKYSGQWKFECQIMSSDLPPTVPPAK